MRKSMMQPPESKLSSAEMFVLILMSVLLIDNGSCARSSGTFAMLTETLSMRTKNSSRLFSVEPILYYPVNIRRNKGRDTHTHTKTHTHKNMYIHIPSVLRAHSVMLLSNMTFVGKVDANNRTRGVLCLGCVNGEEQHGGQE